MMTKISMAEDADSWCRQLGNFAPIVYRPLPLPAISAGADIAAFESHRSVRHLRAAGPAQRRGAAAQFLLVALVMTAIYPLSAVAQMQGGGMGGHGGGGHGSHGGRPPDAAQKSPDASVARAPDPLRAMLSEARKLRTELLLTADQIGPWSAMEDALRESIELNRRHAPEPGAQVDPQLFVQDMADSQRALADAEARFAAATKAAFATLNPRQLRTTRDRFASAIAGEQATATTATP